MLEFLPDNQQNNLLSLPDFLEGKEDVKPVSEVEAIKKSHVREGNELELMEALQCLLALAISRKPVTPVAGQDVSCWKGKRPREELAGGMAQSADVILGPSLKSEMSKFRVGARLVKANKDMFGMCGDLLGKYLYYLYTCCASAHLMLKA